MNSNNKYLDKIYHIILLYPKPPKNKQTITVYAFIVQVIHTFFRDLQERSLKSVSLLSFCQSWVQPPWDLLFRWFFVVIFFKLKTVIFYSFYRYTINPCERWSTLLNLFRMTIFCEHLGNWSCAVLSVFLDRCVCFIQEVY